MRKRGTYFEQVPLVVVRKTIEAETPNDHNAKGDTAGVVAAPRKVPRLGLTRSLRQRSLK
jgi:hypothetical protein